MINSARGRVLLGLALAIVLLATFFWVLQRRPDYEDSRVDVVKDESDPSRSVSQPSPLSAPAQSSSSLEPTPAPESLQDPARTTQPLGYVGILVLRVPVAGVKPEQLQDTFKDARSERREHDAIDIPAAAGTPVVAAADGEIVKLLQSERGGTTIYQLIPDKNLVLYYAHLQRYADGLAEGKAVREGEVIGYVGDTGNAGTGNYHLHFSISIVADPKRYWEGTNINPYPFLQK